MPRRNGIYRLTSIEIREDLMALCIQRKWNKRKMLEEAVLARITPEDLAYLESRRLEVELEKNRKIIEDADKTRGIKI